MNKADTSTYQQRLLALRARLRGDVLAMADVALRNTGMDGEGSAMPIHMAELGSDNFEQEFTLSLVASEEDTLQQIDQALARIAAGIFGQCRECGGAIPKKRLNAIPYTPVCIKCAEKMEEN